MWLKVREICGIATVPEDRSAASEWLRRHTIHTIWRNGPGGKTEYVCLNTLPEDVRRAYLERVVDGAGLDMGEHDDRLHTDLLKAPLKAQERAHETAAKLLFIVKRERVGMTWGDIEAAGKKAFGKFATRNAVKGWKRKTEGVDPANWAPVLAPGWSGSGTGDAFSTDAKDYLVKLMILSGKNGTGYPLKHAFRTLLKEAKIQGWDVPKLHTVRRWWNKMDPVERMVAELGETRAEEALRQRIQQHSIGMTAMDVVEGDGREFKVRVQWPDGSVSCPWVVAFVDRASRKTVGWAVGKSENADVTEAAIVHMCETHYRPNVLYFDNGSAFNSKRIRGGQRPYFRTTQTKTPDWDTPGVLSILGIEGRNFQVGAKTANLQENVWSHQRAVDNHPAFHGAQRPGPDDPENRSPGAVPVQLFEQVLAEAVYDLNAETDNRVNGLSEGESRAQAFKRLSNDGAKRIVTPLMRRRLGLIWKQKTVQRDGTIRFDGGVFGNHTTQSEMLRHKGKVVLVGFNPANFDQPAMVCGWDDKATRGRLILEDLPSERATEHGSSEGRRKAIANKYHARNAVKKVKEKYLEIESDLAKLRKNAEGFELPKGNPDHSDPKVVELATGNGFFAGDGRPETGGKTHLTDEHVRKFAEATQRRQEAKY